MKLGLFAINFGTCGDPAAAVQIAQAAEDAGFESVWTGEHIVLPDPMRPDFPMPPETPLLDTIVALTWIAAHTKRLRVGSGIILIPPRNPVILAKELASVDVISGGRLIVGVGAGWLEAEFRALGVSMDERGKRMDDALAAMRALWTLPHPTHQGPTASFSNVASYPRPLQRPTPPIVIAGHSRAAMRRAVTMGNGWYGFALTLEETRKYVADLKRLSGEHARPAELGNLEISVTPIGPFDREMLEAYEAAGVHRLIVLPKYNASHEQRHSPVPRDAILRNIEMVSRIAAIS
ncbi:MAG TPA: LLM class F420-dependent oxidoreductase [Terriglobales bacterium]|nr:LLM class F420-dependent oxidoreductase [Terriglobales bacterium]